MKKLKSALSLLLCMIMVFGAVAVGGEGIELPSISDIFGTKATAATSGTCGDNLTWSFDESTGTLEISGTGNMANYSSYNRPWEDSKDLITTVNIGNGVTSIGDYAFSDFHKLAKVSIPYGITKIGTYAFEYCSSLTSVAIPNSVTSIGSSTFKNCTGLTSLTIPDSVTSIGSSAFESCTGLTSLTIPNSVTTIGNSAFSGCTGLTSLTIPDSVTEIGRMAVSCGNLAAIDVVSSSANYSSADGVLFDKGKTRLIQYPEGKEGTAYSIPAGVTSIEFGAFAGCSGLTSITIPDSVTCIGYGAFDSCTGLTNLTIPDSVTTIGGNAFNGCSSITSITIPDSVTTIGNYAFDSCTGLTSLTIPDSVTSIGGGAFYGCSNLTSVTIGNGVASISYNKVFNSCDKLSQINVKPGNLLYSSVDGVLFSKDKTKLIKYPQGKAETSYTVPDGVTSIVEYAFRDCNSLTSITIPDSVTTMDDYAFDGCRHLTSVYISDIANWCSISFGSFGGSGSSPLMEGASLYLDGKLVTDLVIPNGVTSIGDYAFRYYSNLTSVTIPAGVTNIGECAFYKCSNLTSITIPAGVKNIGDNAFEYCSSLTSITIPDGVTNIGDFTFEGCSSLTSITIPDSVTRIGWNAFASCSSLTSITIPDGVTSIDSDAFEYCRSLTSITIPAGVTKIGYDAFGGCSSLVNITIPDGITCIDSGTFSDTKIYNDESNWENGVLYIGNYLIRAKNTLSDKYTIKAGTSAIVGGAFSSCSNLTDVTIPDSVISIGDDAFYKCTNLTSVTIPDSVINIGDDAFCISGIYNNEANWENNVLYIGNHLIKAKETLPVEYVVRSGTKVIASGAFEYCSNLTSVTLPDSVMSIGDKAFYGCSSLTSITIPDGVTNIGKGTFFGCLKLTSVSIPDSVIKIGDNAFYRCDNLTQINVAPQNTKYLSEDGVLFNKEMTELILYPPQKKDTSYSVPNGVVNMINAFGSCPYLERISIPGTVTGLNGSSFVLCAKIKSIDVDPANPSFSSDKYGALYDKNKTVLLMIPYGLCTESFYLPDTTEEIYATCGGDIWWSAISACYGVESFVVGENNANFSSDSQGVLYNKDKTGLIKYPGGRKAETYVMPATVTGVDVGSGDVLSGKYLQRIEVASGNDLFYNDENGILFFDYDGEKVLTKIPNNTPLDFYEIPQNVNRLYLDAFSSFANLKRIHFSTENAMIDFQTAWFYNIALPQVCGKVNTVICMEKKPEGWDELVLMFKEAYDFTASFEICDGNHDVHKHTPKTVTVPASCTVDGMEYEVCSECGETIGTPTVIKAKGHTEVKDIAVKPTCTATGLSEGAHCSVCNTIIKKQEVIPATGHTEVKDIAVKPTCTATGLTEGAHCSVCNTIIKKQEVIPATGHTSGDWVVVTEPTADADGKRVKKCTVCGTILSEEILPKLTVAVDEKTGIELDYSGGDYSGKVELSVEETFDGAAFNLVNTQFNVSQSFIYDIKMTVDGVETQPTGTVKVRIPLPEGFDPARTFIYHVDTETGKVVKMAATYKDGYLEFETDHFSYYAVVEEAKPCKLTINTPSTTTVSYGFTLNLHANVTDLPEGARIVWSMDGSGFELIPSADGMTCGVKSVSKGSATITAKVVDKNGNALKDANGNEITASQQLTSKAGFFQKLVAFFKKLFGSNMVIPSSLNKLIK